MSKINKKEAIVLFFVVIGLSLMIAGPYINWNSLSNIFKQKQIKYEKCIEICKENNTCIKYDFEDSMFFDGQTRTCVEYSKGACQNICVEKYK